MFSDLINFLFSSAQSKVHGNRSATREARKKCQERQFSGTHMKEKASS